MSKNIKEIGKELLGKSLNSFHRKTGLTQLEKNNEMQDGILNGILSQVDDAYIEKTEQSNVIHLDGSGDGVVVLDSIEGNTMVNIFNNVTGVVSLDNVVSSYANNTLTYKAQSGFEGNIYPEFLGNLVTNYNLSTNKKYTFVFECNIQGAEFGLQGVKSDGRWVAGMTIKTIAKIGVNIIEFTTPNDLSEMNALKFRLYNSTTNNEHKFSNFQIYEGDISTLSNGYFKGIKSSFEEKVNDEGKYEIEILSNNKNLVFEPLVNGDIYNENGQMIIHNSAIWRTNYIKVKPNTTYIVSYDVTPNWRAIFFYDKNKKFISNFDKSSTFTTPANCYYIGFKAPFNTGNVKLQIEKGTKITSYTPHKSNKIKLLLNEPLRSVGDIKDRLCVKDGKLMIERNIFEFIEDGSNDWNIFDIGENRQFYKYIPINLIKKSVNEYSKITSMSNNYGKTTFNERGNITSRNCALMTYSNSNNTNLLCIYKPLDFTTEQLKTELNNSPLKMCYQLAEPYYEEVNNEYGEPIILEGYENGTLYMDSTIIPTTTVRYTPKMESLNTLKKISNNNTLLSNDINDNIITYMMEVDLMIMEKEMALPSQINNRKMEVLDMTSMQKRTQEMLERLIKGKTLTEQECKTRVTTYLNAGKITDEQAEELMLVISEIYN